jgi:hypothetical protein
VDTRSRPTGGEAALGFRAHSGWAVLVAVAGPAAEPTAVLRRRVDLSARTPRQPFHATEGKLFRDVLRCASRNCGLALVEAGEHQFEERASRSLRRPTAQIRRRLAGWGKALGPPWTQDQKRAALVAWLALSEASGTPA